MPVYKAAVFDLDGVIADTARFHYLAWKKLADELGIYFDEKINERLKGVGRMESLEMILEKSPRKFTREEKEHLAEKKNGYYKDMIEKMTQEDLLPGAGELILALKGRGVKIALASASRNAPIVLKRLGIEELFDYVVDAARIKRGKPDPEIFLVAAENLGLKPGECVGMEDSTAGIEAIKRAGMFAVGIGDPQILKKADIVLKDLKNFREILRLFDNQVESI
ncbi:beta-phosphoglucomutase [Thermosediminibacter oceani]|uniref:Beta-phosphoglucomutase n=1 Tax=Thermosediminibacter oceani (strain ATCC BAA-1034 / DSM 16646 / JW/IW-1228P) TaxID=555079 RepID=D9RYS9_THEOJ|nr:beta-phosphoglucomutase [Thermosediminibacter oceani]ADL08503.1 beta-phosphoglucomutase [Thermosediminibacter oceani DSM 16646]